MGYSHSIFQSPSLLIPLPDPDNPKTAQPEQKAASTSKAAQSEWMYINNFDSTSCIQLVHRKTHEPVDHESEHYNIYKEIRDRCDLAKLATGMTLEHLIAEGTQSQLDFNAGKVEAVKERMSTADLIAEKMREKVDAAEKDFWARQAAQN